MLTQKELHEVLSERLGCPFCGELPEVSSLGTCIDIDCCCSMSLQKSDHLTLEERETFSCETYRYSDEAELKAMKVAIDRWNTRATYPEKGNDMQLTDKQYNRLVELVRNAYESSTMEKAGLDHIWPSNDDPLPATEKDVTAFIKRRTDLYRKTWQMTPLREALQILADVN